MTASASAIAQIADALRERAVVPYLGPGMLGLCPGCDAPATPEALAGFLTARVSVPHKIRGRLTQAAQFVENFKHRKTVVAIMSEAFDVPPRPSALHRWLARLAPPMIVDAWYDDTMLSALRSGRPAADWGQVQGLSQSEHFGTWHGAYGASGGAAAAVDRGWRTLLYRPLGGRSPAANYLVSDSDYVEVLTEIDIQTPIPEEVQSRRAGRHFLFLGCRFDDQLTRSFARQITKRSSARHWAVLAEEPTRMEARFLDEQGIRRLALPLAELAARLTADAALAA